MARLTWIVSYSLLALFLVPAPAAHANDSAFGGRGSELIPLKETRIQMTSEDIVLTLKKHMWHIEASYVFTNPTDKNVTLQMGFPEEHCDEDEECMDEAGIFKGLVTKVRGKVVKQKVGKVNRKHDWAPHLGRVYVYTVTFAPREVVPIHHTYRHPTSAGVDGTWVDYITRTGSLWNGPIGRAKFTVRTPTKPWKVAFPATFKLSSYRETPTTQGGMTEFIFEMSQWTPKVDFVLMMHNAMNADLHGCPAYDLVWTDKATLHTEIKQAITAMNDNQLRICRNLPYARHGYSFKDARLFKRFYPPMASGTGSMMGPNEKASERWTWVSFRPNPDYTPSLLSGMEQAYIKFIKTEENRRAQQNSNTPAP